MTDRQTGTQTDGPTDNYEKKKQYERLNSVITSIMALLPIIKNAGA